MKPDFPIRRHGNGLIEVTGYSPAFDLGGGRCVPVGYYCDGATVPFPLVRWRTELNRYPYVLAAVTHDYRYDYAIGTREEADADYRDALITLGFPRWRAWLVWAAVRMFGGRHYSD